MNTVVLEVRSLTRTLADATHAMWELLKAMCGAGSMSIREAARRVDRDVKAVHGDITALLDAGVLSRTPEGEVEFPFDAVKVEFLLQAA